MSAGPELVEFRDNLHLALDDLGSLRKDAEAFGDRLDSAGDAAKQYLAFRFVITTLDGAVSSSVTMLKLSENFTPLKPSSRALKEVLEAVQPVIVRLRDVTDKAGSVNPNTGERKGLDKLADKVSKADDSYNEVVLPALETTERSLSTVRDGTEEFVDAFDRVSTPDNNPLNSANTGSDRPGKASFTQLFGEADVFVRPANDAAEDAARIHADAAALFDQIAGLMDIVDFDGLNAIFSEVAELGEIFEILAPIVEIVETVLRPLQPLLDAVDLILSTVVDPAVDYLVEGLGLDALFDEFADQIEALLPSPDLFDGLFQVVDDVAALLDQFDLDQFDVTAFTDAALEAFDRFEQTFADTTPSVLAGIDGIPLRIGDDASADADSGENGADTMHGTGGHEAFDPRSGNDTVLANAGNDIIVASAGDDTIKGGAGIDRLVFAGELAEYDFTRNDETGELIFTHTDVGAHGFNEGSEVVTGVEFFDFGTETFTKEQFENAIVGQSVLEGTDEGELIFLNPGGTLVDGLTLNGETFNGMNVVYGLGGGDRIQGTTGKDFISGGEGDDLLVPRTGEDALDGGPGSDTFQIFNLGFNSADRIDLEEGFGAVRGGFTRLASVENLIVQNNGDSDLFGNASGNALVSGGGRDMLSGRAGNDAIFAGGGRDVLWGGQGVDSLRGGEGNDFLGALNTSDNGAGELYDGEEGRDTLSYATGRDEIREFLSDNVAYTGKLNDAMRDAATTGPVVIRVADGEVDRLEGSGNVIATDIARNIEHFVGSDSADTIFGAGDSFIRIDISGGGGNDTLHSRGATEVSGGRGDDLMIAERGPDGGRVVGSAFYGDGGFDTLDLRPVGDARFILKTDSGRINVTAAAKDFAGNPLNARGERFNVDDTERFILGSNDDWVQWGTGTDGEILGGAGNDYLRSASGVGTQMPTFRGEAGNDTIVLDDGGRAFGGIGDDRIEVKSGGQLVAEGGEGNDTFYVTRMDNRLDGGAGFDKLILRPNDGGGVTVNLAAGTAVSSSSIDLTEVTGIEEVVGSDAADTVTGTGQSERMYLAGGNDRGEGRGGDDQLYGGDGTDSLFGGAGNDTLSGGAGNDRLDGGADTDSVSYAFAGPGGEEGELVAQIFEAAVVDLGAGVGGRGSETDTLVSIENVFGTLLGDEITGDDGDNLLSGRAGADILRGQGGDDVLVAGAAGPTGAPDQMFGGDGDDRFVIGASAFFADGGAGSDLLDFSGGSDPAEGGGRTLAVSVDLAAGSVSREVEAGRVVWAEGGGSAPRSFEGQSISPTDVLRADPLYAHSAADLSLSLPTGEEEGDGIPSFAIEVETNAQSLPVERGAFTLIEDVRGTASADVLRGDGEANRLEAGAGDDELEGRGGNDQIDGGDGEDTAVYSGDFSDYRIELRTGGITVSDKRGIDGVDTLQGIELLAFADGVRFSDDLEVVGDFVNIVGTPDPDELAGGLRSDNIDALGGDDTIMASVENDQIDGGEGEDTIVYSGDQSSYTLTLSPTVTTISDRRDGGNGTDTLIDMEFLNFDSGDFALNQFGGTAGLSEQNFESFIELYIAYFNRAPDAFGLNFWGTAFANGTSLEEMATLFVDQDETRATYPDGTSNTEFATSVYNNVLGRTPDQSGIDFWVGALDSNAVFRDQFILEVLRGAKTDLKPEEGQVFVDQQIADRAYLENKVDIGEYFAVHRGMSDVDNATSAMALFDGTQNGKDQAVAAIDDFYQEALAPTTGEFLMQVVGVLDNQLL
jgi:Ca2+-binding RTX toxin-like protein